MFGQIGFQVIAQTRFSFLLQDQDYEKKVPQFSWSTAEPQAQIRIASLRRCGAGFLAKRYSAILRGRFASIPVPRFRCERMLLSQHRAP